MNDLQKYNHTISVLVKAYLNNTLMKGTCYACAVGNMIAEAIGGKVLNRGEWSINKPAWYEVFMTDSTSGNQHINPFLYAGIAKEQIDATGYSYRELARIEKAFENAHPDGWSEEAMYAGLMAVVDVLGDIHNIDQEVAQQSKLLFVK